MDLMIKKACQRNLDPQCCQLWPRFLQERNYREIFMLHIFLPRFHRQHYLQLAVLNLLDCVFQPQNSNTIMYITIATFMRHAYLIPWRKNGLSSWSNLNPPYIVQAHYFDGTRGEDFGQIRFGQISHAKDITGCGPFRDFIYGKVTTNVEYNY